jgi:UDP-N-acetylglucosamine 1-carboxyvinyltransferase
MDKLRIEGGYPLKGTVRISGAKNAALPLMSACLLTDQPLILRNLPNLADIQTMCHLLESLGVTTLRTEHEITLTANKNLTTHANYDLVRKMRASILALGPLVSRHGHAEVSLPGGCAIGVRPVDLHIKGLEALGATIELKEGYIHAYAKNGLRGTNFSFPVVSVTGTENLLMAACLAKGQTKLLNAAQEPEVTDLVECLVKMGAKIQGIGTDTLTVEGVKELQGASHSVVPDRIETGTYIMAAGITKGELELTHTRLNLLPTVIDVLEKVGLQFETTPNGFKVRLQENLKHLKSEDITTAPYPGFPTDLQAQFMALMTLAEGTSTISETIWENRFMHVAELLRMSANIRVQGSNASITGVSHLIGAPVMATDLRASASLVLAGLAAQGETLVNRVYHLDRGYESMEKKLRACGALIERISENN